MIKITTTNRCIAYITTFLLVVFLCISPSLAQETECYIQKYQSDFSLKFNSSYHLSSFTYNLNSEEERYNYFPNSVVKVGIGASWKGLSVSWGYGFDLIKNGQKGDTKSSDLQFNYHGKHFIFETFAQKYNGFYMGKTLEDIIESDVPTVRPDIELIKYGLFGQYVFNGDKFSYRAPFGQKERQLRSAGSFQVGMGFYYTEAKADSSLHPINQVNESVNLKDIQFGPNFGYSYTWVLNRFFVTTSLSIGANIASLHTNNVKYPNKFSPSIYPRCYGGYNANDWSINLSYTNNWILISSAEDNARIEVNTGRAELTFVKRFYLNFRPKVLDKVSPNILKIVGFD